MEWGPLDVSVKATVRLECEFGFMIYLVAAGGSALPNITSKRPILFLFIMHSGPWLHAPKGKRTSKFVHSSSSMNSTMTVPFLRPASAIGTSSISMRFLPMLMSSKFLSSLPSKGAALSHS